MRNFQYHPCAFKSSYLPHTNSVFPYFYKHWSHLFKVYLLKPRSQCFEEFTLFFYCWSSYIRETELKPSRSVNSSCVLFSQSMSKSALFFCSCDTMFEEKKVVRNTNRTARKLSVEGPWSGISYNIKHLSWFWYEHMFFFFFSFHFIWSFLYFLVWLQVF